MAETLEQTRRRLKAVFEAEKLQRANDAYARARTPREPKEDSAGEAPRPPQHGNRRSRAETTIKGPRDPRLGNFKRGDLVQVSMLGIKRQRASTHPKTVDTKGIYYGPARVKSLLRDRTRVEVYVDWFVSEPWDRLHRSAIDIDYLEPLGTPR